MDDLNSKLLREELNYNTDKLKIENIKLLQNLNHVQRYIYEQILESLYRGKNNFFFFICGQGGTSKTYL